MTDNKLIADFMGQHFLGPQYHHSWDWLIPVVQKIRNLHTKKRLRGKIYKEDQHHPADEIFCLYLGCDIKRAHNAVVEFIKWYNSLKK